MRSQIVLILQNLILDLLDLQNLRDLYFKVLS